MLSMMDLAQRIPARVLWVLPAFVHAWMARNLLLRPGRIVHAAYFDTRGNRHVTRATYVLGPARR